MGCSLSIYVDGTTDVPRMVDLIGMHGFSGKLDRWTDQLFGVVHEEQSMDLCRNSGHFYKQYGLVWDLRISFDDDADKIDTFGQVVDVLIRIIKEFPNSRGLFFSEVAWLGWEPDDVVVCTDKWTAMDDDFRAMLDSELEKAGIKTRASTVEAVEKRTAFPPPKLTWLLERSRSRFTEHEPVVFEPSTAPVNLENLQQTAVTVEDAFHTRSYDKPIIETAKVVGPWVAAALHNPPKFKAVRNSWPHVPPPLIMTKFPYHVVKEIDTAIADFRSQIVDWPHMTIRSLAHAQTKANELLNTRPAHFFKSSKELPELDAFYLWEDTPNGQSLIIGYDGTFLYANSTVTPTDHKQAFINGHRTPIKDFT